MWEELVSIVSSLALMYTFMHWTFLWNEVVLFFQKAEKSGPKGADYWFSRVLDSSRTRVGGVLKERSHCFFFVALIYLFDILGET